MHNIPDQPDANDAASIKARQFLDLRDSVMSLWEKEVRERVLGASQLDSPALTDTLPAFYENVAEALGLKRRDATSNNNAATVHGGERARVTGLGPDQIIHEYQILREAMWREANARMELTSDDWDIIDRSINHAMRDSARGYASIQNDLRSKLAGALSHDMRTPLAVIVNALELVSLSNDFAAAKVFAAKAKLNAKRLEAMMTDLLDAFTSNAGDSLPLKLTSFDANDLVEEIRAAYAGTSGRDLEVTSKSVNGYWCYGSLRRAMENLVNNAISYGDQGPIAIVVDESRGRLMLSVHNTGSPIAKERQDQIFEYFNRDGGPTFAPGWGLGLPFVKRVAQSHGGSIAVDSSTETGTTFQINIPVDARPYVAGAP